MSSSRDSSQCRDRTQVSRIAGGFFSIWATREALLFTHVTYNSVCLLIPNSYFISLHPLSNNKFFWACAPVYFSGKGALFHQIWKEINFPGGSVDKESACNARDPGSITGLGRSSEEGNGYPLQYSCLENSTGREAWWATVHGVTRARHNLATKPSMQKSSQITDRFKKFKSLSMECRGHGILVPEFKLSVFQMILTMTNSKKAILPGDPVHSLFLSLNWKLFTT